MSVTNGGEEEGENSAAGESKVKNQRVKEGGFLLGSPTFVDLGNGRWRCDETGHDLPANEKESYSHSKACRVALIDAALAKKKPLLNAFQPHPISKSMLVCILTGDVINKSEQHIWKHINGRRFLKKLEEKEVEKLASPTKVENNNRREKKTSKLKASSIHKNQNLEADKNGYLARESETESADAEEPSFWVPPVGERWDLDDGRDRWETHNTSDQETEAPGNTTSGLWCKISKNVINLIPNILTASKDVYHENLVMYARFKCEKNILLFSKKITENRKKANDLKQFQTNLKDIKCNI
ncbi:hypothetical protein IEQ34_006668 [Dendrobium chrysotoxum]|uniref:Surfeit locus protein 2 n=1 Tax=Dendrobium chrysotoxum TaxID=161865 RepID=A0AAV7H666_DENCH|nr:hypothetical protein IEQ34_006668 [Dendrobium chrysotoxum]